MQVGAPPPSCGTHRLPRTGRLGRDLAHHVGRAGLPGAGRARCARRHPGHPAGQRRRLRRQAVVPGERSGPHAGRRPPPPRLSRETRSASAPSALRSAVACAPTGPVSSGWRRRRASLRPSPPWPGPGGRGGAGLRAADLGRTCAAGWAEAAVLLAVSPAALTRPPCARRREPRPTRSGALRRRSSHRGAGVRLRPRAGRDRPALARCVGAAHMGLGWVCSEVWPWTSPGTSTTSPSAASASCAPSTCRRSTSRSTRSPATAPGQRLRRCLRRGRRRHVAGPGLPHRLADRPLPAPAARPSSLGYGPRMTEARSPSAPTPRSCAPANGSSCRARSAWPTAASSPVVSPAR